MGTAGPHVMGIRGTGEFELWCSKRLACPRLSKIPMEAIGKQLCKASCNGKNAQVSYLYFCFAILAKDPNGNHSHIT